MPTIPIFTAERGPGVFQLPNVPPPVPIESGGEALAQFGQRLADIDAKIRAQQDDLDLLSAVGEFELGLDSIRQGLTENPDYQSHEMSFMAQTTDLSKQVRQRFVTNPLVGRAFQIKEQQLLGKAFIDVRHTARTLQGNAQLAQLEMESDRLSREAAEAATSEQRGEKIQLFESATDRMLSRGYFGANGPLEAEKKKIAFRQKVLQKNMDYVGRTNRPVFWERYFKGEFSDVDPNTRMKIAESVRTGEEHEERRAEHALNDAKKVFSNDAYGQANFGLFPRSELEDIKKGNNPFMSAQEGHHLEERNENSPSSAGNRSVMALQQEYRSGKRSAKRIEEYRHKYNALARDLGVPNTKLSQAFDELNAEEASLRTVEAAELSAKIKIAEDTYKTQTRPTLPGMVGQMQKNRSAIEMAEIRNRIRRREKIEDVLKDLEARHKKRREQAPQPTQDVQGLLKGLK